MNNETIELENEFGVKDKSLHINFWLNSNEERKKLEDLAKNSGLSKSAWLRYIVIKEWKRLQHDTKDV